MKQKVCSGCKLLKDISHFWKNKKANDGLNYSCIECHRIIDRRRYYRDRENRLLMSKHVYQNNKEGFLKRAKELQKKYPEKYKARYMLKNAVKSGKIIRGRCEVCGDPKTHGHHDDYSKPLQVRWLCKDHHFEFHRTLGPPPVIPNVICVVCGKDRVEKENICAMCRWKKLHHVIPRDPKERKALEDLLKNH